VLSMIRFLLGFNREVNSFLGHCSASRGVLSCIGWSRSVQMNGNQNRNKHQQMEQIGEDRRSCSEGEGGFLKRTP
jgi:hypothetical protein